MGMSKYAIAISPDEVGEEFRVVLRGPGIESRGRRYIFASTYRCSAFIEAVNFAYEQGLRDGRGKALLYSDRYLVITGTTPEDVAIQREGWWACLKRRLRGAFAAAVAHGRIARGPSGI
jgi:hypothetical protein